MHTPGLEGSIPSGLVGAGAIGIVTPISGGANSVLCGGAGLGSVRE